MKNLLRSIILVLVTGLFLVVSTGFQLTVHYCSTSNYTGLHLFKTADEQCRHEQTLPKPEGCCQTPVENSSSSSEHPVCCTDTTLYFSIDDHLTNTDHISGYSRDFSYFPLYSVIEICEKYDNCSEIIFLKPPPPLPGIELFRLHHQLLL